ncbi:MAG: hypothetical protein LBK94_06575 [Prevotellaceae bacterium]|nr:hypothetical protein [Prevotellaceae bacterium]
MKDNQEYAAKEFKFQGVDAKTECKLGLMLLFLTLLIFISSIYIVSLLIPDIYFLYPVFLASGLTVVVSIFILKFLSNAVKNKQWIIHVNNESLDISFKNHTCNIPLDDIRIIKNMGNSGFRYLTITANNETIKIRVGNTVLVPFSTAKDILTVDALINYLKPYINERFNKKILKNQIDNNVFPFASVANYL